MRRRSLLLALLLLFIALPARASIPEGLEGKVVVAIEVIGAGRELTSEEVGLEVGDRVTRHAIRVAIQTLLGPGRQADVQVDIRAEQEGARVIFHVRPQRTVRRLELRGLGWMPEPAARRRLKIEPGAELTDEVLQQSIQRLLAEYSDRGFLNAWVDVKLRDTDDPSQKTVVLEVHEEDATTIASVQLKGDPVPAESGLGADLGLRGARLDRETIDEQVRKAEQLLRAKGWLEAKLGSFRLQGGRSGGLVLDSHIGPRYTLVVLGHTPLSKEQVEASLQLDKTGIEEEASLAAMGRKVRELYQRQGFHDVSVEVDRETGRKPGEAFVVVRIRPGRQLIVQELRFPGAGHFAASFLRGQVHTYLQEELGRKSIIEPFDPDTAHLITRSREIRARHSPAPHDYDPRTVFYADAYAKAVEHLVELYHDEGYLDVRIDEPKLKRGPDGKANVEIAIVEGPRTHLYRVDLRGNEALSSASLLRTTKLRRGMPFNHLFLRDAIDSMLERYREAGYLYARIESELHYSTDRTRVEVVLHIVERFEVRIGEVLVEGAELTSEGLIRDVARIPRGELLRPSTLRAAQERLLTLGIFSGVTVEARDPGLPSATKDVLILVKERKRQVLDGSVGVSTGEGLRGSVQYGYRNIFGLAMGFDARVRFAYQFFFLQDRGLEDRLLALPLEDQLERRLSVGLTFPYVGLDQLRASLTGTHQRENERDFGYTKYAVDLTLAYRPSRKLDIALSQGLEHNDVGLFSQDIESIEQLLLETNDPRLRRLLLVPEGRSSLVATQLTASLDLRDNAFNPTRGAYLTGGIEWARMLGAQRIDIGGMTEELISHHLKLTVALSGYFPIAPGLTLAAQAQFGRIVHLQDRSETYPNRLFFMGGINTIRGYADDTMVPQDLADEIASNDSLSVDDIVRGGDAFLALRAELRFPIIGALSGALFADLGNLWAQASEFNPLQLRPTAGVGLRVDTPVGPLAVDYGFILLRRRELGERTGALHFSIGVF